MKLRKEKKKKKKKKRKESRTGRKITRISRRGASYFPFKKHTDTRPDMQIY